MKETIEQELLPQVEDIKQVSKWKRYEHYKGSGIDWLGSIPSHWHIQILKHAIGINEENLKENFHANYTLRYIDISNVDSDGNIQDVQDFLFKDAPSRARRIVRDGDTIISTVRTYLRAIGYIDNPPANLIVSTGFAVLRAHEGLSARFLYRYVQSYGFIDQVVSHSEGVGYPAINPSTLGCLNILIPPLKEQQTIATFLDQETAKLDTLIAKRERMIKLLQERRTAVINQAATKGLNPAVKMKDSGIEWLGDIPEHWEIGKLGTECTVKARLGWKGLKASEYVDAGYIFLSTPNIKGDKIDFENVNYITSERYFESPEIMLKPGDVLIAKDGSTLGIANVVRYLPAPATVNSSIAVIRPYRSLNSVFLYWFLSSAYIQSFIQSIKNGMGVPHLFQADLRKFVVLLPPFEEQKAIATFLDQKTAKIDKLISGIEQSIQKLKEYKVALTSAAVTGKIDVRGEIDVVHTRSAENVAE